MTIFAHIQHWYGGLDIGKLTFFQIWGYYSRIWEIVEAEKGIKNDMRKLDILMRWQNER